jgi:hypothetical protein
VLCRMEVETISHLLINCPYAQHIWKEVEHITRVTNVWIGEIVEECLRKWFVRNESKEFRSIPCLVSWGILLARNSQIFDEKFLPSFKVYVQVRSIMPCCRMIDN